MNAKKSWEERAAELLKELRQRRTPEENVRWHLDGEEWERWLPEAEKIAKRELRCRRWRGARGGVVPGGYDAEALASEAVMTIFKGKARIGVGYTAERLVRELERLIRQRVRVLARRKESKAMRSEWEVALEGGERLRSIECVESAPESEEDAGGVEEEE